MFLNCHNNLDIFGSWEDLKYFFINNSTDKYILNFGLEDKRNSEDVYMVDWDREIMNEKMEQITYVFMTNEYPPEDWLENIAKEYKNLEFNLVYQNREKDISGEIVYKYGDLYCSYKSSDEENYENIIECGY